MNVVTGAGVTYDADGYSNDYGINNTNPPASAFGSHTVLSAILAWRFR